MRKKLQNKKITLITSNYPMSNFPERGAFVEALAQQWKNEEVSITVINPVSFQNQIRYGKVPSFEMYNGIPVYRPSYFSFSNYKLLGVSTSYFSNLSFANAALKVCSKLEKPDLYYGKFLMGGGFAASIIGKKFKKPSFADLGESSLFEKLTENEKKRAKSTLNNLTGITCVSERLAKEAQMLGISHSKILLVPNTVDKNKFKPLNKNECRKKLKLNYDGFIVIFVGHFIERKGPLRVLEAINSLDIPLKGIFLGRGKQKPYGKKVLYSGSVPNNELPIWLNAADIFVLPTLAEGHCNAINEAMACGTPIISSDIEDVRPQVPLKTGILVNPTDYKEIAKVIKMFHDNRKMVKEYEEQCILSSNKYMYNKPNTILNWVKYLV